jgi:hypothetical protein
VIARQSGVELKNKSEVTEGVTGSGSLKATGLTLIREGAISDMRNLLITWIEDHTQKRIPLSSMTITTKTVRFLNDVERKCWALLRR